MPKIIQESALCKLILKSCQSFLYKHLPPLNTAKLLHFSFLSCSIFKVEMVESSLPIWNDDGLVMGGGGGGGETGTNEL
jgi:hypothetical protein